MSCVQDCFVLMDLVCNITEMTISNDTICRSTVACINYFTYAAIALVGVLTVQVIVLSTCLLCCCCKKWRCKKVYNLHKALKHKDKEDIELKESRMALTSEEAPPIVHAPLYKNTGQTRTERRVADGMYDTIANDAVTTKEPSFSPTGARPKEYQALNTANMQIVDYDVIASATDKKVNDTNQPPPSFSVDAKKPTAAEVDYAEISTSSVKQTSASLNKPVATTAMNPVAPLPEYAVIDKTKKRKSVDFTIPPAITEYTSSLPPPIPPATPSYQKTIEQYQNLSSQTDDTVPPYDETSISPVPLIATCDIQEGPDLNTVQSYSSSS